MAKTFVTHDASIAWTPLQRHGNEVEDVLDVVQASVDRDAAALQLRYQVNGDVASLRIPPLRHSTRGDELWKHTCAELFIASENSDQYSEFNFSPSSQWAAYQFFGYRRRMQLLQCEAPLIVSSCTPRQLTMIIDMALPADLAITSLNLGLSMVIEKKDGQCSYWALRHSSE